MREGLEVSGRIHQDTLDSGSVDNKEKQKLLEKK